MLDGPDPHAFGDLPDAIAAVLRDPSYRRAARGLAGAIAALPPVDAAADLLRAIAAEQTLAPTRLRREN
jgi:UDP:flavonoid glycosyltransferase YjiC (YdhE family)